MGCYLLQKLTEDSVQWEALFCTLAPGRKSGIKVNEFSPLRPLSTNQATTSVRERIAVASRKPHSLCPFPLHFYVSEHLSHEREEPMLHSFCTEWLPSHCSQRHWESSSRKTDCEVAFRRWKWMCEQGELSCVFVSMPLPGHTGNGQTVSHASHALCPRAKFTCSFNTTKQEGLEQQLSPLN